MKIVKRILIITTIILIQSIKLYAFFGKNTIQV